MAQSVATEQPVNGHSHSYSRDRVSSFKTLRSSHFVMRITDLTGKINFKRTKDSHKDTLMPYRNAQSMDVPRTHKPFMSQPLLALHMPDPLGGEREDSSPGNSSSHDSSSHVTDTLPPPPRIPLSRRSSRDDSDAEMPANVDMDGPPPDDMLDMMDMTSENFMSMPMRIRRKLMKRFAQYQAKKSPTNWARVNFLGKKNTTTTQPPLRHSASTNNMPTSRGSADISSTAMPGIENRINSINAPVVSPTTPTSIASNGSWKARVKFLGRKSQKSFNTQSETASSSTAVEGLPATSSPEQLARQLPMGAQTTERGKNTTGVNPGSGSVAERRHLPRLASMPPGDMPFIETADRRARLSPSVVARPMPMPILNLPTLTTSPPARSATINVTVPTPTGTPRTPMPQSVARLRSMPLLPMSGASPHEEHEHEHSDEDYMDEDEMMEEDMDAEAEGDMDAQRLNAMTLGGSDEEGGEEGSQSHGISTPRTLSPPPRIELSSFESPGLHLDFDTTADRRASTISTRSVERPHGPRAPIHAQAHASVVIAPSSLGRRPPALILNDTELEPAQDTSKTTREGAATPKAQTARISVQTQEIPRMPAASTSAAHMPMPMEIPAFGSPKLPPGAASPDTPSGAGGQFKRNSVRLSQSIMPPLPTARPGIYHQASRSMVDLAMVDDTMPERQDGHSKRLSRISEVKGKGRALDSSTDEGPSFVIEQREGTGVHMKDMSLLGPPNTLVRRRSLPMFNSSGPPPPYPTFLPGQARGFKTTPRDEEGMEGLPRYSNDIYLIAIMPRKQEFSAPGVQARDRKWRRVLCVLEGTAFRVYALQSGAIGVGVISGWWEKKVGVGDVNFVGGTFGGPSHGPGAATLLIDESPKDMRIGPTKWADDIEAAMPGSADDAASSNASANQPRSRRLLGSNLLHPSRANGPNQPSSRPPSPSGRSSLQLSRSSSRRSSHSTTGGSTLAGTQSSASSSNVPSSGSTHGHSMSLSSLSVTASRSPTRSHFRHSRSGSSSHAQDIIGTHGLPEPQPKDLLREYSLQNAESGLASDYLKRKNVMRVRMEGEQFLLQAVDISAVVEWIEGLQAATNISLDLDERPMPRGPIFPRRRRRRRIRVDGAPGSA